MEKHQLGHKGTDPGYRNSRIFTMRLFHLLWLFILLLSVEVSLQQTVATCSNQRPEHVYIWGVRPWQQVALGETTRYWCERGYKRTGGATPATCTRNGWMPHPLCEAITCSVPAIENGYVSGAIRENKEDDVLHYECDQGFKRSHRPSTCMKQGVGAEWNPTPLCEPMKCKLPTTEGVRYEPADKSVFSPGEKLEFFCSQTRWIFFTTEIATVTTCQKDGEWSIRPTCQELGCGTPPLLKDGDIKYSKKPNYNHNERVEYQCQSYYTMEGESFRTCISGEWTGHMRCLEPCIVNEDDHKRHNITLKSDDRKYFTHDEIIEYRCARGLPVGAVAMLQRCNSGVILLPSCQ